MNVPELVDLHLPIPGFYNFISSWLLELNNKLFVIDPGPSNSLPLLYKALGERIPDYILLTHIHVDHAGGVGDLSKKYPSATIVAHEKAFRHLVDPSRLIEGSRKTLGGLMDLYGEIKAVREECILKEPDEVEGLPIIKTPGHAAHHISFVFDEYIFCGEALGVICPMGNEILTSPPSLPLRQAPQDDKLAAHQEVKKMDLLSTIDIYLRPATPPVFDLEAYMSSIALLESVYKNQTLCFGHYGFGLEGVNYFQKARDQIELWCRVIGFENHSNDLNSFSDEQFAEILEKLFQEDPSFETFKKLPPDIQERERRFVLNSVKGIFYR